MNVMIITIPPPTDYDQTKRIRRCPWCFDEAAPSELGVATPQAMKLAIAAKPLATMEGGWLELYTNAPPIQTVYSVPRKYTSPSHPHLLGVRTCWLGRQMVCAWEP